MRQTSCGWLLVSAAALMMCLAPCRWASAKHPEAVSRTYAADVILSPSGELLGRVTAADPGGEIPEVVTIYDGEHVVAEARVDEHGAFRARSVGSGVRRVAAGDSVILCRVWPRAVAPPAAVPTLELTASRMVVRGQRPLASALFSDPLLLGAIIGAAIAIPIAIHNSDDDPPAS